MGVSVSVSILIPVFNVEQYLEQCLKSVVAQSLEDIEIICIDDGSTDTSPKILAHFAAKDPRIKVITKTNGGYGMAMNCGLDAAQGEYVGIVESDDYIDTEMFSTMYATAKRDGVDIVKTDFFLTWTNPTLRDKYFRAVPPKIANKVITPYIDYAIMQPQPSIWSAIYRRSFLETNALTFSETPGAAFQDTAFNYCAWAAADSAIGIPQAFLHYRQDNSASSINSKTKSDAVIHELQRCFSYLERFPQRKDRLQKILQGIAYKTYRWNLRRVDDALRSDFLETMQSFFTTSQKQGLLEKEYFESTFFAEAQLLLAAPAQYLDFTTADMACENISARLATRMRYLGPWTTLREGCNVLWQRMGR